MLVDLLYVTQKRAVESGMTHEGAMFGCPAWLREEADDVIVGTPKVPLLQLWCLVADAAFETLAYFVSTETVIESPISVGRRIA